MTKGDTMSSKRRRKKKARRNHAANHGKRPQS
ncbi:MULTISPECIES: 50S ribosomal protein L37 [Streptomyces]